jgi:hypothetical protein
MHTEVHDVVVLAVIHAGVAVSSDLYNLQQREDIIRINVSNLRSPHDQVFMEFLASVNGSVVYNSANISGYTLCFNASTSVRDALANAMIPVDTICGSCGEITHYCIVAVTDASYNHVCLYTLQGKLLIKASLCSRWP